MKGNLDSKNKQSGFTLIELIIVIILIGILSSIAYSSFVSLGRDAKIAAIKQVQLSAKTANDFMYMKSHMPSYSTQIGIVGRDDLLDVDTNADGQYDTRLKWFYLDNTDVEKRIDLSDDFSIIYEGIEHTYIGFDTNKDNDVRNDDCYFKYTQASSINTPPTYMMNFDGC
ncbi:prepilin-type N-terminal cleavage/methylation domain-containing protein [Psychromonas sp. RZ22]|nr:prepilin-type N-terminal cleavage/methylation domain-containing protein [Psychromonas sp. RZ22]